MSIQGTRVRVRVLRCVRTDDAHGGVARQWEEGEERWAVVHATSRVLPSQESINGIVHSTTPTRQGLYKLYMRTSQERAPFERIRWKGRLYSVISHEMISDKKGWDLMWLASLEEA